MDVSMMDVSPTSALASPRYSLPDSRGAEMEGQQLSMDVVSPVRHELDVIKSPTSPYGQFRMERANSGVNYPNGGVPPGAVIAFTPSTLSQDVHCGHIGCPWISSGANSKNRRYGTSVHEHSWQRHRTHFDQLSTQCPKCRELERAGEWPPGSTTSPPIPNGPMNSLPVTAQGGAKGTLSFAHSQSQPPSGESGQTTMQGQPRPQRLSTAYVPANPVSVASGMALLPAAGTAQRNFAETVSLPPVATTTTAYNSPRQGVAPSAATVGVYPYHPMMHMNSPMTTTARPAAVQMPPRAQQLPSPSYSSYYGGTPSQHPVQQPHPQFGSPPGRAPGPQPSTNRRLPPQPVVTVPASPQTATPMNTRAQPATSVMTPPQPPAPPSPLPATIAPVLPRLMPTLLPRAPSPPPPPPLPQPVLPSSMRIPNLVPPAAASSAPKAATLPTLMPRLTPLVPSNAPSQLTSPTSTLTRSAPVVPTPPVPAAVSAITASGGSGTGTPGRSDRNAHQPSHVTTTSTARVTRNGVYRLPAARVVGQKRGREQDSDSEGEGAEERLEGDAGEVDSDESDVDVVEWNEVSFTIRARKVMKTEADTNPRNAAARGKKERIRKAATLLRIKRQQRNASTPVPTTSTRARIAPRELEAFAPNQVYVPAWGTAYPFDDATVLQAKADAAVARNIVNAVKNYQLMQEEFVSSFAGRIAEFDLEMHQLREVMLKNRAAMMAACKLMTTAPTAPNASQLR